MLKDVQVIRPLAILLIVIGHAFIIYRGDSVSWPAPEGYVPNQIFSWIYLISTSFHLQAFVFIAGYVYAHQYITKRKDENIKDFVIKKSMRLLLPGIIFSIIYYLIFYINSPLTTFEVVYQIANGMGHMWFLPMLFWVYIFGWITRKVSKSWFFIVVLAGASILSFVLPDFLRISSGVLFFFYFVVGYKFYEIRDRLKRFMTTPSLIAIWLLFFGILILYFSILQKYLTHDQGHLVERALKFALSNLLQLVYATAGLTALYLTVNTILEKHLSQLPKWVVSSNIYCYGVYFFHQFILKYLFYNTEFCTSVFPNAVPFLAILITIPLSVFLTHVTLKTSVGKRLIS